MKTRIATAMFLFLGFCTAISIQIPAAPKDTQKLNFSGGGSPTPCPPTSTSANPAEPQDTPFCPNPK
jgi:hypothetical protein